MHCCSSDVLLVDAGSRVPLLNERPVSLRPSWKCEEDLKHVKKPNPIRTHPQVMGKWYATCDIHFFLIVLGCSVLFFFFLTLALGMELRTNWVSYGLAELCSWTVTFHTFWVPLLLFILSVSNVPSKCVYYSPPPMRVTFFLKFVLDCYLWSQSVNVCLGRGCFFSVCTWRVSLYVELLEFILFHNTPWRLRTRLSSGHPKVFQWLGLLLVLGMWYCDPVRGKKMCTSKSQASCLLLGTFLESGRG